MSFDDVNQIKEHRCFILCTNQGIEKIQVIHRIAFTFSFRWPTYFREPTDWPDFRSNVWMVESANKTRKQRCALCVFVCVCGLFISFICVAPVTLVGNLDFLLGFSFFGGIFRHTHTQHFRVQVVFAVLLFYFSMKGYTFFSFFLSSSVRLACFKRNDKRGLFVVLTFNILCSS